MCFLFVVAYDEAISVGQSPGEWLGLWRDVLGPGPPQREQHGRTRVRQSYLTPEKALFEQRHRSAQVPPLGWVAGAQVLDGGEHVSHRQQQQHCVASAGLCLVASTDVL